MKAKYCALILGFLAWSPLLDGQEKAQDRRKSLDRETIVSNDPRRIPIPPLPQGPDGTLVLKDGRIFDGTGAAVREGSVVIHRNRIEKILPAGSSDWPADARVIDAKGGTIMPGLIDLHTHLSYTEMNVPPPLANNVVDGTLRSVERLRFFIECGITSVRDVASMGDVPFRLKDWVSQNRLPGPRVFPAGQLITGTGGHGAEGLSPQDPLYGAIREASGPDDWREAVREQFKRGADVIKLASHYSREEIAAAVDEAHALGLKVCVDAETFYIQWAVEAGADVIEHPLPRTDETIRLMAQKGTEAVPTLATYSYIFNLSGGYYYSSSRRFTFSHEDNLEVLRRMKEAGVKMGVGTDLVVDWFRFLPDAYITELEQFVAAGYTIPEALVAATKTSAEILDMEDKLGTLEAGKLADVIVVEGKPDENLDDLARVDIVIRDGYLVVDGGQVVIPRHETLPEPEPKGKR
jgi:imidazolonepropionase-like amidohydrolase